MTNTYILFIYLHHNLHRPKILGYRWSIVYEFLDSEKNNEGIYSMHFKIIRFHFATNSFWNAAEVSWMKWNFWWKNKINENEGLVEYFSHLAINLEQYHVQCGLGRKTIHASHNVFECDRY